MVKRKVDTVDITLVHIDSEIYPRATVDEETVETYRLNMDGGQKFAPLVVQKGSYTLIDGRHRYEALRQLERKKVHVEIRDIPDNELRAEAIRLNVKHGKRLTKKELRHSIIGLRFRDEKKLKEIAEIVGLTEARISQICQEYEFASRYFDDINNLIPKVPKIDLRVKVDADKKDEIAVDLDAGMSGNEVAEKYRVSPSLVSRIKKDHEAWKSAPVYIRMDHPQAGEMFRIAFMNRILKKAQIEFKEKGALIRNSEGKSLPLVVAMFKDESFVEYKVKQPVEGYIESDVLTLLKNLDVDRRIWFEVALVDSKAWKIRDDKTLHTIEYSDVDWREFPIPNVELDENGIPTKCTVKAEISRRAFPRNQKGELTLVMKDEELGCSFKCPQGAYGWDCNQKLELEFLEKNDDARAIVDLEILDRVVKVFTGYFWIGMWSDRSQMALGYGSSRHKFCFII